ncbi:MAG: sterol desaturase family protein [Pikeienuella sp.]
MEMFANSLAPFADALFGPHSRLAPVYVGFTVLLAILIWCFRGAPGTFLSWVAPRKIYLHPSHMMDIKLLLIGRLLSAFKLVGRLALSASIAVSVSEVLRGGGEEDVSSSWPAILVTLALVLVSDFKVYWVHRLHHQISVLWPFHEVHHSAEVMTPLTVYRKHPIYDFLSSLVGAVLIGLAQGVLLGLFIGKVETVQIVGANALYFVFNAAGANFRHSHIWISYGWFIEHVLISPAQHQAHHSIELKHRNKNFGEIFAIWDWMFGTLYIAKQRENLTYGLSDENGMMLPQPHATLRQALFRPIGDSWRAMMRRKG